MKWIFLILFLLSFKSYSSEQLYFSNAGYNCPTKYFTYSGLSSAFTGCKYRHDETVIYAYWSDGDSWIGLKTNKTSRFNFSVSPTSLTCEQVNSEFSLIDGVCKKPEIPVCEDDEYLDQESNICLPIKQCPEAGTFAKKLYGKPGFQGYSVCSSDCVIEAKQPTVQTCTGAGTENESCNYDAVYTGASCVPGDGTPNPPGHEYPSNPNPQPPTDPLPPGDLPGTPSPTPSPTPTPKPNPNPTPDPVDPNLGEGDASIVQKLDVSNKYLENIDVGIDNLIQANNNNNKELISYQKFILGELQNGIGGGGGGGGSPGEGECDPDTEECSGDGNTVKENACTEFTCEGDNIACYLARREWEKKCQVEDFINPEGDGSKIMDEFTKFIDENPVENIESGELDVGRIMNKYTNGNGLEITAGCPAPRIVDAKIASFTVNYEPFCDLALVINWFLISLSMVGATLLISKYGL